MICILRKKTEYIPSDLRVDGAPACDYAREARGESVLEVVRYNRLCAPVLYLEAVRLRGEAGRSHMYCVLH